MASAETVRDLLLPGETVVLNKWLPAETVRVIQPPAESLGRKQNHTDSLHRKPFLVDSVSAGSKRSWTVSAEAKYDGWSLQVADSFIPCDQLTVLINLLVDRFQRNPTEITKISPQKS